MAKTGYEYVMVSRRNGTLYIGVTSDLARRVWTHENNLVDGFTSRYSVHRLVYYDRYDDIRDAIRREKQIKKWRRRWKLRIIEEVNPTWRDMYEAVR